MRKVKQQPIDTSKVFIDKSGNEKSNDPILKRIRDIHIKEPITPQTFLQPIPPNLERVPGIQKKQVNMAGLDDQALIDEKLAEIVKSLLQLEKKGVTKEDANIYEKFVRNLPSRGKIMAAKNLVSGNYLQLLDNLKQIDRENQNDKKRAKISEQEKLNIRLKELEEDIKRSKKKQKEYEQSVTNEKAKKVKN